ncbi:uncharacterized protein EDB93DRAFT_1255949 [Suillus bovinus]|uniref:uncharacterized protein n=1 Tax=Suillus bovinus TaxID=48563 RepID=UPI001B87400D|nr:uncharacterized protein EDB93DRAFT_1256510 [Suillus bovinus]XP_041302065.1 uncharacterized protein EDB93DRAFT_1255949 [Suillus bovinus]KAG2128922.1 hypothetical protein EDB93DRAFT_1256510 [Suillus bovinus]KAG2130328.1 hypothetical protein EDB93DRAFT_1255949 [Suillus bovinus]
MAPKASQEVSTRRTRPANANTHPGRPVLELKLRSDSRMQRENHGGIKAKPVHPRPVGKGKKTSSPDITNDKTTSVDPEDTLLSDGESEVVDGKKKKEKVPKTLLKEAIKNACKTDHFDSDAHALSDKKGNNMPLSESTLLCINQAVSSTTKKLSLGGLINSWANDVPAELKSTILSSRLNTFSASHAATTPPSLVLSTSTKTSSRAKPAHINQKQSISTTESNDVLMVSDNSLDDPEALEHLPAVLSRKKGKQLIKKSTLIVPTSESDSEPEQIMFSAQPGSIKRKADNVGDFVDETASEATDDSSFSADDSQASLLPKVTSIPAIEKGHVSRKTTSTSTVVSQGATPPPSKKLKKESFEVTNCSDLVPLPSTQVPAGYYDNDIPPPNTQVPPASQKATVTITFTLLIHHRRIRLSHLSQFRHLERSSTDPHLMAAASGTGLDLHLEASCLVFDYHCAQHDSLLFFDCILDTIMRSMIPLSSIDYLDCCIVTINMPEHEHLLT